MTPAQTDDTKNLHILGNGSMPAVPPAPSADLLEAFPNRYKERNYIISISFPEFTSLCPVTGQPDFGTIRVEYIPDELCVESKSLKLYLFSYRNYGSFMETITNSILDDLTSLMTPRWCRVMGFFAPRGATAINVFAEYTNPNLTDDEKRLLYSTITDWRIETLRRTGGRVSPFNIT